MIPDSWFLIPFGAYYSLPIPSLCTMAHKHWEHTLKYLEKSVLARWPYSVDVSSLVLFLCKNWGADSVPLTCYVFDVWVDISLLRVIILKNSSISEFHYCFIFDWYRTVYLQMTRYVMEVAFANWHIPPCHYHGCAELHDIYVTSNVCNLTIVKCVS